MTGERSAGALTVARALRVLDCFTTARPEWGVTELAQQLGTHKPSVHRILTAFVAAGYLVSDPRSNRYRLGHRLITLGEVAQRSDALALVARPVLARLARQVGENATLVVRDGARQRLAAAVDGPGPLHFADRVGATYPWYAGSTGHAIFAHLPDEEIERLAEDGFEGSSVRGPRSLADVRRRHEHVRLHGYSVSAGEFDAIASVSAPVSDNGTVIASIGVIGVEARIERERPRIVAEVLAAADELSGRLGGAETTGPPPA